MWHLIHLLCLIKYECGSEKIIEKRDALYEINLYIYLLWKISISDSNFNNNESIKYWFAIMLIHSKFQLSN